ncbi:MAG TPA: energy transducer TonB [Burkholderiales bacterium]|nr:energy transducer TonB [Burkholderiales bacterium]
MWHPDLAAARWHHDRQLRTLYACLGVSVTLHVLAMLVFPGLRPVAAPADAPALTALFASADPVAPFSPRKPRERRESDPLVTPPKPADPVPIATPRAAEPAPVPAVSPEPAAASSLAPAPAAVSSEAPARPVAERVDPSLFDAYRLALIDAAKRYKRYPVQAMERGWEGRVEIRVVVDANGTIKSALIKSSSKYQVLDDQALEMVRKAFNALAQVQPAPRGREFTVDVPVVFELQTG